MAEQAGYDEEERAWAVRVARAFLAPPGESPVASRQSPDDEGARPVVVLAVAVVPLAVPPEARGDEATRRRGDERQEDEGDG